MPRCVCGAPEPCLAPRWGGEHVSPEVWQRWEHDEGIFTVKCENCGQEFATNCTGWVVCANCINTARA